MISTKIILLLSLVVFISGCATTGQVAAPQQEEVQQEIPVNEEPKNEKAVEFSIESGHVMENGKRVPRFLTNVIEAEKGDRIRINITNFRGTHDFKIDEFNVYTETPVNQTVTVEFTADKAGEFVYYCARPGHRANGHWGTLIVKE